MGKWGFSYIAVGNVNDALENILEVSQNNHEIILWPSNPNPGYKYKKNKNMYP